MDPHTKITLRSLTQGLQHDIKEPWVWFIEVSRPVDGVKDGWGAELVKHFDPKPIVVLGKEMIINQDFGNRDGTRIAVLADENLFPRAIKSAEGFCGKSKTVSYSKTPSKDECYALGTIGVLNTNIINVTGYKLEDENHLIDAPLSWMPINEKASTSIGEWVFCAAMNVLTTPGHIRQAIKFRTSTLNDE